MKGTFYLIPTGDKKVPLIIFYYKMFKKRLIIIAKEKKMLQSWDEGLYFECLLEITCVTNILYFTLVILHNIHF